MTIKELINILQNCNNNNEVFIEGMLSSPGGHLDYDIDKMKEDDIIINEDSVIFRIY